MFGVDWLVFSLVSLNMFCVALASISWFLRLKRDGLQSGTALSVMECLAFPAEFLVAQALVFYCILARRADAKLKVK